MKCQSCGENDANIHFTKIVNGKMEESHLCEECAKKESDWGFNMPFSVNDLFGGLGGLIDFNTEDESIEKVCPNCGMSYKKILSLGKFGCNECYETFEQDISSLLKSIHGHDKHIGKIPRNSSKKIKKKRKIEELRLKLDDAVLKEDFESAAIYRDEIKSLEREFQNLNKDEDMK